MALIKEPYGLVYNTDRTLCTTYRDDNVPFRGVRSFAVETATTNFMPSEKTFVEGTYGNSYPFFARNFDFATLGINNLEKVTFSLEFYNDSIALANGGRLLVIIYRSPGTSSFYVSSTSSSPTWVRKEYTFQRDDSILDGSGNPYTGFSIYLYHYPNHTPGYTHIRKLQVEKKPFASSFVDGSRPTGVIAVPFHIDLNTEDWVVSFWHKMTNTYSFASKIIFSIDGNFHLNTYFPSLGKYNWVCVNTDNAIFRASSTTTVDTNWNFIVLVKNGSNFKVYINEILEINLNYTGTLKYNVNNFKFGNFKIGELGYVSHSLFSNIFIGKYRKPNGEIIWTDEYIREVYEAKIPFSEQNKLSIY